MLDTHEIWVPQTVGKGTYVASTSKTRGNIPQNERWQKNQKVLPSTRLPQAHWHKAGTATARDAVGQAYVRA